MKTRRPHLLFLARSFPPHTGIATIRTSNVAKYLSRHGWRVTVVMPHPDLFYHRGDMVDSKTFLEQEGIECVYTEHHFPAVLPTMFKVHGIARTRLVGGVIRRVFRWLDLDCGTGWILPVLKSCRIFRSGEVDLILATGAPFASFLAARRLSQRLQCPYVLDYRDPWTLRSFHNRSARPWTRRLERYALRRAASVIHVSPLLAEEHIRAFGGADKVHSITNGFDPEVLGEVEAACFDGFTIVYAGRFYEPHRVIAPFFRALRIVMERRLPDDPPIRFRYYGIDGQACMEAARQAGVEGLVEDFGRVSQRESWAAIKGSDLTLVISSVRKEVSLGVLGNLPGKVFEVLGLNRPMLVVAPPGSQIAQVVEGCGGGKRFSGDQVEEMAEFILKSARLEGEFVESDAGRYAWPELIRKLDSLLREQLTAHPSTMGQARERECST